MLVMKCCYRKTPAYANVYGMSEIGFDHKNEISDDFSSDIDFNKIKYTDNASRCLTVTEKEKFK